MFEISQNVILTRPDGAVLVLEHKSGGRWLLPGGRINKGEGWLDGLRREVREETGITDFHIKGIVDFDTWLEGAAGKCVITFAASVQGADVKLGDEHIAYAWVEQDDLGKYDFWNENIKKRIEKFFSSSLL